MGRLFPATSLNAPGDSAFTQDHTTWNLPATPTTYADTSIAAGNTYYYRVSAVSSNGTSDPSTTVESVSGRSGSHDSAAGPDRGIKQLGCVQLCRRRHHRLQWYLNGSAMASATGSTLLLMGATSANAGVYTCSATNSSGSVTSSPASLSVVNTSDPGRLINLSCRAGVGNGKNILIAGFAVGGAGATGQEPLLVRASGPALEAFGVERERFPTLCSPCIRGQDH